eukprot:gnl/Dysnectes_brevis/1092_a1222_1799.p1 GENE.gnl/Dysnectes_brevis/1092_a1222_1799~~gnl/Dysnectes_brevis/1092_a1222_1799.p1  ORF type:complete len:857 (-),score=335.94 gnl/Dysnectes_brevis/1092_a1222_1799:46-2595(-)
MYLVSVLLLAIVTTGLAQYKLYEVTPSESGYEGTLELTSPSSATYCDSVETLNFDVTIGNMTNTYVKDMGVVRIRITDANADRFEVPNVLQEGSFGPTDSFPFIVDMGAPGSPFGPRVIIDGHVVFNAKPPTTSDLELTYQECFLQLTSWVDVQHAWGLGLRMEELLLPLGHTYTLFNNDRQMPMHENLYGSHPFMVVREEWGSYGVFLLNANAMEVELQEEYTSWRPAGGILDLFVLSAPGATPLDVMRAYHHLVGLSVEVPVWSLGWQQSRWMSSEATLEDVEATADGYTTHELPLDVQYLDIEYMRGYRIFTFDPVRFPEQDVRDYLNSMHALGRHVVPIVDPGVKLDEDYDTYNTLRVTGAFLRNPDSSPLVNEVWPGQVIFPDWHDEEVYAWWLAEWSAWLTQFPELEPNGWCDMNSPACFVDCQSVSGGHPTDTWDRDYPPFRPGDLPLCQHTVTLWGEGAGGQQWDTHNVNGHQELIQTRKALNELSGGLRPFTLTRSSFSGTPKYTSHWLGDDESSFLSHQYSYHMNLQAQMMGFTVVGADIGGFNGDCWDELFLRWVASGTVYTFSRDHTADGTKQQEPWEFEGGVDIVKAAVSRKYRFIHLYYTRALRASEQGDLVLEAPAWRWPCHAELMPVGDEAMLGPILFAPVLLEGATGRDVLLPSVTCEGHEMRWYNYSSTKTLELTGDVTTVHVDNKPGDLAPAFVQGGSVVFESSEHSSLTVTEAYEGDVVVTVWPDSFNSASGELIIDDGVSMGATRAVYQAVYHHSCGLIVKPVESPPFPLDRDTTRRARGFLLHGMECTATSVTLNGEDVHRWVQTGDTLTVDESANLGVSLTLTFEC